MTKIIGISGYAGSGKDTLAEIIINHSSKQWEVKKYAAKLKQVASILTGIPAEDFEKQEVKCSNLPLEWTKSEFSESGELLDIKEYQIRKFLQELGTEAIRDQIHTNAWVNGLWADYKPYADAWDEDGKTTVEVYPNWIITDMRFPNEMSRIREMGGITIRIHRKGLTASNAHISDTALDDADFDIDIHNDGTLDNLTHNACEIVDFYDL